MKRLLTIYAALVAAPIAILMVKYHINGNGPLEFVLLMAGMVLASILSGVLA